MNRYKQGSRFLNAEVDSGFVKLVVMTNVFFNNPQQEIKTKRFICVKQIKSSFFSNMEINILFIVYVKRENRPLQETEFSVKTKQLSLASSGVKRFYKIYFKQQIYHDQLLTFPPNILRLVEVSRRTCKMKVWG